MHVGEAEQRPEVLLLVVIDRTAPTKLGSLRVLPFSGPRFSPFGQLATKVIAPRIGPAKLVPGPPKRFAQAIGATLSVGALVAFYLDAAWLSWVLVGMIMVAALLESALGYCLGCAIFGRLQAIGVIPASVCEACNDVRLRSSAPAAT